jgi:hypothetical protein
LQLVAAAAAVPASPQHVVAALTAAAPAAVPQLLVLQQLAAAVAGDAKTLLLLLQWSALLTGTGAGLRGGSGTAYCATVKVGEAHISAAATTANIYVVSTRCCIKIQLVVDHQHVFI